jgi:preprotein translocase subunit SecF
MKNIIGNKKWFLSLSAAFVTIAIALIVIMGIRPGIDFKSGSTWQIRIPGANEQTVEDFFKNDLKVESPIVAYDQASDSYAVTFNEISDATHQDYLKSMKDKFGDKVMDMDFGTVSPSISSELRDKAVWIIVLVLVVMALFITFAFRKVSWPVRSFRYGIVTLLALVHDVVITAGIFAVISYFTGISADTNFIIALLTVASFSVQDTIVVFDRIRENLIGQSGKTSFGEIVNKSVNEVFRRSINTTISIILPLAAIAAFGPLSVKYFALTILIGLFFGAYSSIFVASPLLVLWHGIDIKNKRL